MTTSIVSAWTPSDNLMQQHELEQRYRKLTMKIEALRMRAMRREDMMGSQIGVVVNDDVTLWGTIPTDPAEDEQFVQDLVKRAKAEARKQE